MADEVLIVYDGAMLGHNPTGWDPAHPEWTDAVKAILAEQYPDKEFDDFAHPERPTRLSSIVERLTMAPVPGTRWIAAEPAEPPELYRAHSRGHVDFIEALAGRSCWLSVDTTAVSPDSVSAAKLAAGAGVTAVEAIRRGEARRAFCAVRPPGHHATADHAMGFCLYNNAAVTATHARALGYERILIFDWDLHHGNGTQDIFYADPQVLFVDTHCEAPFYPGTGLVEETGQGAGEGYNLNIPLPHGSGTSAMLAAVETIIAPAAAAYRPELVLVSAGFDCHRNDQAFTMDEQGFGELAAGLCRIADAHAGGRLVALLEGGYNAESLAASAHAVVEAMAGIPPGPGERFEDDPGVPALGAIARSLAPALARIRDARS